MSVFSQLDLTLIEFNLKKIGVTAHLGSDPKGGYNSYTWLLNIDESLYLGTYGVSPDSLQVIDIGPVHVSV